MKQVSFEKALECSTRDMIMKSQFIKDFCKKNKRKISKISKLQLVADEVPMPMAKINEVIKSFFDEYQYIQIMSHSKFYVVEYNKDEYND